MTPRPATTLPWKLDGWCTADVALEHLLALHKPSRCVEIGTWFGQSALVIAKAIRPWGGTLLCVDPWEQSSWAADHPAVHADRPKAFEQFCSNVWTVGYQDTITPYRGTSMDAAKACGPVDFVFVDGAHDTASVTADLAAWWPLLTPGGTLCGDDYTHPPVQAAWTDFLVATRRPAVVMVSFIAVRKEEPTV